MQQREQRILKKLAEAREAQASAMSRFIQARARVMRVETHLQTLREQPATPTSWPEQPEESMPAASPSTTQGLEALPGVGSSEPPAEECHAPNAIASTPSLAAESLPPFSLDQPGTPPFNAPERGEQALETEGALSSVQAEMPEAWEDEEDTKKVPSFRPPRSPAPARQNADEEETLIVTRAELLKRQQESAAKATRRINPNESTAKMPVLRREPDQAQEPQ